MGFLYCSWGSWGTPPHYNGKHHDISAQHARALRPACYNRSTRNTSFVLLLLAAQRPARASIEHSYTMTTKEHMHSLRVYLGEYKYNILTQLSPMHCGSGHCTVNQDMLVQSTRTNLLGSTGHPEPHRDIKMASRNSSCYLAPFTICML
jgi:hypothetical protein